MTDKRAAAMARKLTAAQRRALLWLANAGDDTPQKASHWMIGAHISAQTVHSLQFDRFIRVVSRGWDNSIDTVRLTAAGRAAVTTTTPAPPAPACDHDWRQVEMDAQECAQCGATRLAYSGWQPF